MKRVLSMTRRTASSRSSRMSAYWALRSSSDTVIAARVGMALMVFLPGDGRPMGSPSGRPSRARAAAAPVRARTAAAMVHGTGSPVHPALVLEPLLDRHVAPHLRGRAHHD